ncbi:MAG: LuxR C-terminal-related transcriptional regulator [Pseudomonadota bacterium]
MGVLSDRRTIDIFDRADIAQSAEALRDYAAELGPLSVATCANIARTEPMRDDEGRILSESVFGWCSKRHKWWLDHSLALVCPVTQAVRYESEPFVCRRGEFRTWHANPYLEAIDATKLEEVSGVKAAICTPVHMPFGVIGAVTWATQDADLDIDAIFDTHAEEMSLIARRFINGYARVMNGRALIPEGCRLTKREIQCLRWAAYGKTDQEISMIMSRSPATIRFHIKNAALKLDTVNRSQTIYKAAQLGYLSAVS